MVSVLAAFCLLCLVAMGLVTEFGGPVLLREGGDRLPPGTTAAVGWFVVRPVDPLTFRTVGQLPDAAVPRARDFCTGRRLTEGRGCGLFRAQACARSPGNS